MARELSQVGAGGGRLERNVLPGTCAGPMSPRDASESLSGKNRALTDHDLVEGAGITLSGQNDGLGDPRAAQAGLYPPPAPR